MGVLDRKDYAVISRHELGHPMVRVFWKRESPPTEDDVPNHTKTFKPEDHMDAAVKWVKDWYMYAVVLSPEETI